MTPRTPDEFHVLYWRHRIGYQIEILTAEHSAWTWSLYIGNRLAYIRVLMTMMEISAPFPYRPRYLQTSATGVSETL